MADPKGEILDVAVVGGGISGVYSAWRLLNASAPAGGGAKNPPKPKIALFESSKRIGGRLLSVTPPHMPHVRCELGGMRYMSSHTLVRSLVENKLGLETKPMPVGDPNNLAYLRGRHLRQSDLGNPEKVPYDLAWAERGKSPDDILGYAINQIIPGVTAMHGEQLQQILRTYTFEGKHLYDLGYWNLLARAMSREAYEFSKQSGGYDTTSLNWNAADTIVLNFDFTPDVQFKGLVKGYEEVPTVLCDEFKAAGGKVYMEHRLKSFEVEAEGKQQIVKLTMVHNKEEYVVRARSLVLAMPRRSLELLDAKGPLLGPGNAEFQYLLRSVTPIPLFKLFVCYPTPWWRAVGVSEGRSVTDLPLRQCYYWGTEGDQYGADPRNQNSVLMASYDDTLNVDFWAGLRDRSRPFETNSAKALFTIADDNGSPDWDQNKAPRPMIDEIHRQLLEMHGLRYAPEPYAAAFRDWGEDPYGGGVNFWNINYKSWEVIPRMVNPVNTLPIYICGEAYSDVQGWAEGALRTAEIMLQSHFRLPPPDWVTQ